MLTLHNNWREQQLAVFQENCSETLMIQQDQDLIDFIRNNNYTTALAHGDTEFFGQYLTLVKTGTVDFCIFIINEPFVFADVVNSVNNTIQYNMNKDGIIYLAINKFLSFPFKYRGNINDDYDQLIYQLVEEQVNAEILDYSYVEDDQGIMFNFAHPLTRFYLKV
jgi:hypothetical protein